MQKCFLQKETSKPASLFVFSSLSRSLFFLYLSPLRFLSLFFPLLPRFNDKIIWKPQGRTWAWGRLEPPSPSAFETPLATRFMARLGRGKECLGRNGAAWASSVKRARQKGTQSMTNYSNGLREWVALPCLAPDDATSAYIQGSRADNVHGKILCFLLSLCFFILFFFLWGYACRRPLEILCLCSVWRKEPRLFSGSWLHIV